MLLATLYLIDDLNMHCFKRYSFGDILLQTCKQASIDCEHESQILLLPVYLELHGKRIFLFPKIENCYSKHNRLYSSPFSG